MFTHFLFHFYDLTHNFITWSHNFDDALSKLHYALKNKKGTIEITYSKYILNKGIPPSIF